MQSLLWIDFYLPLIGQISSQPPAVPGESVAITFFQAVFTQPVATFLGALATASIAYVVAKMQSAQKEREQQAQEALRNAEWRKEFREVHAQFWSNDLDYTKARSWIACDEAFKLIQNVFQKKLDPNSTTNLTPEDYQIIESFDRFCAILLRVKQVNLTAPAELDSLTRWEIDQYNA
ncbi:MAG: hypothetical protein ACK52L_10800, partial [Pirellula sp.]